LGFVGKVLPLPRPPPPKKKTQQKTKTKTRKTWETRYHATENNVNCTKICVKSAMNPIFNEKLHVILHFLYGPLPADSFKKYKKKTHSESVMPSCKLKI
jgi:hypothetical protein